MSIKPKLDTFDLTMIMVSMVIGIGIFRTPAIVAEKSGSPSIFIAAWITGGLVSICGALTFAEIGSRLPAAGGFYRIFSYCYHPAYAFMLNWSMVIINAASAAGVAMVGAEYINAALLPVHWQQKLAIQLTAVVVVFILFLFNYSGIKTGARTQNILSGLKIVLILLFCFAFFIPNEHKVGPEDTQPGLNYIQAFGLALISVFFTYGGYQNTVNFGADISQPQKNIPKSIFAGMSIVILLYLLINLAYLSVLGFEGMRDSKLIAADLAEVLFGPAGFKICSVAIFISILGFVNTSLLYNPRIWFAMTEDGLLPSRFAKVNPRTMVQEFSLALFTAMIFASVFFLGTFERIINYVMSIDSLALITAAAALFILRSGKQNHAIQTGSIQLDTTSQKDIFKMRFYPFVPLIFISTLAVVFVNVFISDFRSALYGICIFVAGLPLYFLLKLLIKRP